MILRCAARASAAPASATSRSGMARCLSRCSPMSGNARIAPRPLGVSIGADQKVIGNIDRSRRTKPLVVAVHGVAGLPWLEHRALLDRIGGAVGALVVDGLVARLPQQAGRHRGSRAPSRGRIGEPDATLRIDDPDRLGDAVQDRTQQFARPGHRRRYARTASTRLWSSGALRKPSLLKMDVTWRSTAPTVTNCASAIPGWSVFRHQR
jgi:hypothetical protein